MSAAGAGPAGRRQVVLVGLPGVGKATVGTLLARTCGLDFVDADDRLEARRGRTIAEPFAADGEPAFRVSRRTPSSSCCPGPVSSRWAGEP